MAKQLNYDRSATTSEIPIEIRQPKVIKTVNNQIPQLNAIPSSTTLKPTKKVNQISTLDDIAFLVIIFFFVILILVLLIKII